MSDDDHIPNQFGPVYDLDGATLKKYRGRVNGGGVMGLPLEDRRAYAEAVEKAVLAKQRSQLKTYGEPNISPSCASGTWKTTGEEIDKAIRQQHRSETLSWPGKIRRARTPEEWQKMYDEAMQEKREREQGS